jgi:hypothetical protein
MAGDSTDFYAALEPFEDFADFVAFGDYAPLPDDWWMLIADVAGSTQAIREGRYKSVNMVGASAIMAVLNVRGTVEIPFAFGGDGATLAVPPVLKDAACSALLALQARSRAMFGLELRVGAVALADLHARGQDVRLRKYRLSPGNHLAMFAGDGVELAERLVKTDQEGDRHRLQADADVEAAPDLAGLSCRWDPLVSSRGCMMNVMVQATAADAEEEGRVLAATIAAISGVLGHDLTDHAPASRSSMHFRWPPRGLLLEARATAGPKPVWRRYLEVLVSSLLQAWAERTGGRIGPYDAPPYGEELRANTDFRKYDGMFRTLLDVTPAQAVAIEAVLEEGYRAGDLIYGTHTAPEALMTCLLFDLEQSEHVHFVDGGNGGFAMAAVGFKARLAGRAAAQP